MTERCGVQPHRLVELLDESAGGEDPELRAHVRRCPPCREELEALQARWEELPASAASPPPRGLRQRILQEAREAVASPGVPLARLWGGLRRVALSVGLGAAGAGLLVLGLGLRGHLSVTEPVAAAWLAVLLAAGLGVVGYGLTGDGAGPGLRGLLAASLASFVGYAGLNLLHPIPRAVDFCRVSLLGAGELSTGSLCLIYLGVAALYAGAPAGLAAWRWDGRGPAWAMGLTVAVVVTLLAVPFHGLQLGAGNLALVVSALLGLGLGSLAGASAGSLLRHRAWRPLPLLLIVAAAVAPPDPASAQALPSHTATGITAGFNENAARSFVRFLGRSGLVRGGASITDPVDRNVHGLAVVNGAILGGFTPYWTTRVIVPWVRKSMDFTAPDGRRVHYDASGVGEAILQSKWIFFRENRVQGTTRLGVQGRLFVPVTETEEKLPTGQLAPQPLQVGDGSWDVEPTVIFTKTSGRWGLNLNAGWRLNAGSGGFEAGDAFSYDAAVGFRFVPWVYESLSDQSLVAYLELNGWMAGQDRIGGELNQNSGGHVLFLSPDLQWIPTPWLLFEGSVRLPVVQDLNGTQLEHDPRLQVGTRVRFSVFR